MRVLILTVICAHQWMLGCRLDDFAVSVFYLRAGYTPNDYPSEIEWDARRMMERSTAVSCPTVAYQLVGAKKIQQDLAVPGVQAVHTTTRLSCT
jgi:glutathione synthase